MTMKEEVEKDLKKARINKDKDRANILQVALSDMQAIESRDGSISDDKSEKAINKIIDSNIETIHNIVDQEKINKLLRENDILRSYLPEKWSKNQIKNFVESNSELKKTIVDSNKDGEAIGKLIKSLKQENAPVENKEVAEIVREIRKQQ